MGDLRMPFAAAESAAAVRVLNGYDALVARKPLARGRLLRPEEPDPRINLLP